MCKHTTTIYICGHWMRNMTPTGPECVYGHLHPYGLEAVFHISKVGRICPGCDKGNDERAGRASEEQKRRAAGFCGVLEVIKETRSDERSVEELVSQEEGQRESVEKVEKHKRRNSGQRGFYWGRGED